MIFLECNIINPLLLYLEKLLGILLLLIWLLCRLEDGRDKFH